MKILLTINKTYRGMLDSSYWYVYEPLMELGHEIHFYDTVDGDPSGKSYKQIIEEFKPDLIFCMMTGDPHITPNEPWRELDEETKSGRTKTFNWFCDDTWRFDNFSKIACKSFTVCSTPERGHLEKYHQIGYNNIIVGNWHANSKYYKPKPFKNREFDISFVGAPTNSRKSFFESTEAPIKYFFKLSQEELFAAHTKTKIGVNLSVNDNDPNKSTQMKQRIFEVPAGGGLLLTQYHPGIEEYYEIDKEIITFNSVQEYNKKVKFLLKNHKIIEFISNNGHKRFMREHDSKVRLANILEQVIKI
jgi:spore maturation protein CgeB